MRILAGNKDYYIFKMGNVVPENKLLGLVGFTVEMHR